jgi:hypothetical protein
VHPGEAAKGGPADITGRLPMNLAERPIREGEGPRSTGGAAPTPPARRYWLSSTTAWAEIGAEEGFTAPAVRAPEES